MKKPVVFLLMKIVGIVGIALAIFGFVLSINGFGDFESNNFMIGGFIGVFGLFIGISGLVFGFRSEISKMAAKSARYIQEETREDLTAMASTGAEIVEDAVTRTASAVREGLSGDTVYCKHCGAVIDADSKFCKSCGKEQ